VLVIPPASDRGFVPLPEANRLFPGSVKKAWFAVYTAPRHEKSVHAQLTAKQIPSFLPLYSVERLWKNRVRKEVEHPLFPGYLFVHLDASQRLPVVETAGVVCIIGNGSVPLPVDDAEIQALRIASQCASLSPYPTLARGDTVSVKRGPFRGIQGRVQENKGKLMLVVTVQLIQKAFAIDVPVCDLELAG
jgi:transcription antitermination factor NusG